MRRKVRSSKPAGKKTYKKPSITKHGRLHVYASPPF